MSEIEGFVLAGGAGSRMGRDKARLTLGGKTFVERVAAALREIEPENLYLVGLRGESFLNLPVLPDVSAPGEKRGSILGLHTALRGAQTEWAAVLACDLPFASGELFRELFSLARNSKSACAGVVPRQPDDRIQPLCAVYRAAACLPELEKMRAADEWSLQRFVRRLNTRVVEFSEISRLPNAENLFFNVNTPAEYARAARIERNLVEKKF